MSPQRESVLLALGALVGAFVAAVGIASPEPEPEIPAGVVAVVDGVPIALEDYHRALEGFSGERRDGRLNGALRRRVVERLIDRELLVQRGIELGLPERDPRVRALLTEAAIGFIAARVETEDVSDAALRDFYTANKGRFLRLGQAHVRRLVFNHRLSGGAQAARDRANTVRGGLLEGKAPDDMASSADDPVARLPDSLLPEPKLRDYLGPDHLDALRGLKPGDWSEPIEGQGVTSLLQLVERRPGSAPPFDTIRAQILAEYQRDAGESAVRRFLNGRRETASIAVAEERL